jgi:ribosomal-protein-alanine N-acetyltransferase
MEMVDLIAHHHALSFESPWNADAFSRMLSIPGTFGFMIARHNATAGFILARVAAEEAEILTVAVDPTARRESLGKRLLAATLEMARTYGATEMFLEVAEDNDAALKLYAALGFSQVGRRPDYYKERGKTTAALTLRRAL